MDVGSTSASPARVWTGRFMSGLAMAFLLFDAGGKLVRNPNVIEWTVALGYPENAVFPIGLLLLAGIVLHLVPRTATLGAIYLSAYLGGAVATHLRVGSPLASHTLFPVYFAALIWGGLGLRNPRVLGLLLDSRPGSGAGQPPEDVDASRRSARSRPASGSTSTPRRP